MNNVFYNWSFVPFDHHHQFLTPPNPAFGNHQSVLCISSGFWFFCFLSINTFKHATHMYFQVCL